MLKNTKRLKRVIKITIATIAVWGVILLTVNSCVTEEACRDKYPCLIKQTTIIKDTTVYIPEVIIDSVWVTTSDTVNDTLIITKDKLTVRLVRHNDTILVHSDCAADTVVINKIIERVIEPDYYAYTVAKAKQYKNYLLIAGGIILLIIIGLVALKIYRSLTK